MRINVFPVQWWRFSIYYLTTYLSVKNFFQKSSYKIYIGPLVIYKIIDLHNYLLMTFDSKILRGLFEHERLKPAIIRTSQGNIHNLLQLGQVINIEITV